MARVMYVSGKYSESKWCDVQLEKLNEYCNVNNIELRTIGTANEAVKKFLNNIEPDVPWDKKTDATYSLSSIAAIYDFATSKKRSDKEFFWVHLDMAVNQMDKNIFDCMDMKDNEIYCWMKYMDHPLDNGQPHNWELTGYNALRSLFGKSKFDIENEEYFECRSDMLAMTKKAAKAFVKILSKEMNIFKDGFRSQEPIDDETLIEFIDIVAKKNKVDLTLKSMRDGTKLLPGTKGRMDFPVSCYSEDLAWRRKELPVKAEDAILIHFWGPLKDRILDFYSGKL